LAPKFYLPKRIEANAEMSPQYWGMVFPLGMYTVCTFQLSKAINFEPLLIIPRYFIFIAFAAWLAAFIGLIWNLVPRRAAAATTVRNT